MHLNIKNDDAHRLARELADLKGESLTTAVTVAIEERLARARQSDDRQGIAERAMEIGRLYASLPDADTRTPEEIIGYDENGVPT